MDIRVNLDNASVITRAFAQAPAVVLDELETTFGTLMAYLQREAQENTPTAAGTLRSGWTVDVQTLTQLDAVFGRLTNPLPYALPVELGTRPHWPPYEPILNWVEQKLNLSGDDAEAAARGLQRKIASVGTPGYGMARFALADGRSTIAAELGECAQRIQSRLAAMGGSAGAGA